MQKNLIVLGHWYHPELWSEDTRKTTNILQKVICGNKTDWVVMNKMEFEWLNRAKEALIYDMFDLDIHPEEIRNFILEKRRGLYVRNVIDPLLARHGHENIIYLGDHGWGVNLGEDIKAKLGEDDFGEYYLVDWDCHEGMQVREFLLWYKGAEDEKYYSAIKEWSGIQDLNLAYKYLLLFFKDCLRH